MPLTNYIFLIRKKKSVLNNNMNFFATTSLKLSFHHPANIGLLFYTLPI
jgi:hypothetical protein